MTKLKRLFAVALVLLIGTALSTGKIDAAGKVYDLVIGGVTVTDDNKDDVLGDGGSVKFSPDTNKITLTNANINSVFRGDYDKTLNDFQKWDIEGIRIKKSSEGHKTYTVELVGKNTINVKTKTAHKPGWHFHCAGIFTYEKLVLTGSGSLDIKCSHEASDYGLYFLEGVHSYSEDVDLEISCRELNVSTVWNVKTADDTINRLVPLHARNGILLGGDKNLITKVNLYTSGNMCVWCSHFLMQNRSVYTGTAENKKPSNIYISKMPKDNIISSIYDGAVYKYKKYKNSKIIVGEFPKYGVDPTREGDKNYRAWIQIAPDKANLTMKTPDGNGTLSSQPAGPELEYGTELMVKIQPNTGYKLKTFLVNGENMTSDVKDYSFSFKINEDTVIEAYFDKLEEPKPPVRPTPPVPPNPYQPFAPLPTEPEREVEPEIKKPEKPVLKEYMSSIKFTVGKDYYTVDGVIKNMDAIPFIMSDRVMLPMRYVAEAIDMDVVYNEISREAYFSNDNIQIIVNIDTGEIRMGDRVYKLNVKPMIKNDRVFMPIGLIADLLGMSRQTPWTGHDITWNEIDQTVTITQIKKY